MFAMEESALKEEPSERRSERKKRKRTSFSPDISKADGLKKKASIHSMKTSPGRSYDIVNGQPFCCHMCKSPYVVNLKSKLVKKSLPSRHTPLPKSRIDMLTQQPIQLCNSCVSLYDRSQKRLAKAVTLPTKEEQKLYMEDISEYIQMLKAEWDEPLVERLYCPPNQRKLCGCLQKLVRAALRAGERQTVEWLINLMKESGKLRQEKCYTLPGNLKSKCSIGLGNGHKKSKRYEEFVIVERTKLREDVRLCERATQKVLMYSNNFLHKRLKTEGRPCRIERTRGKAILGKLPDFQTMVDQHCCMDNCVMLALTHRRLLQDWRSRAQQGQAEARRVLAEMLTPAGATHLNCHNFISMVTGCSSSTITSVHSRMMETGGLREPPEHGLKKFWQEHFKKSGTRSEPNEGDKADDESHALVAESNRKKQSYVKKSSAGNSQSVNSEGHIHGFPGITEPSLTSAQHQQYSLQQQQLQQQQLEQQEQQQQQQILLHMLVEQHLAMEQNVSDPQIQSQIPVAYPGAGPQSTMLPVTHVLQQGQFQLYLQPPPKYTENQSAALKQWNQTAVVTFPVTSHPGTSFPVTPMQMASLPVSSFPGSSLPVSSLPVSSFPVNSLPVTSFPLNINQFSNLPQHSNQQHNSGISYSNVVTNSRPDISTKPAPNIARKRPTDLPTPLFQTAVPHHQLSFMPQQISTGNNSINEQKRSVDTACGQRQLPSQIFQQMSVNSGLRYQLQTAQGVFNIESVVPDNHHHLNVQQNEAETDAKTTANPGPSLSDINMESQNSTHQVTSCIYKPVPVLDKETGTTRIIYVPENSENTPSQQQVLEVVATESNTSANIPQVIPDVESNIPITVHINNDGTFTLTMIEDNVIPQNQLIFTHFNSEANNARPTPQATPSEPRSAQMILPNSSQSLSSPNGSSINQSQSPLPQSYLHPSQGGHSHLAPLQGSNSCTVTVPVLAHAHRVQTIEPTNVPKFFKTNSYADISVDTSSKVQHSVLPSQDGNTGMSTKEHLHKLVVSRKKKHSGGEDGQKKDVIEKELARKSRNVSGASNSSRKSVIISHVSTRKHHDSGTEALYRLLGVGTHSRHVSGNSDLGDRSRKSSGNSLISDTSSLPFSNLPSPNIFLDREKGIFCIQSEGGDQCEIEASPYIEEMLRLAEMEPHANFHGLSERCIFKHMVQSMNNASADNTTNVQAHDSDGGWRMAENVETETSNLVMEKSGLSLNENSSIPQLVEQAASGQLESMNTVKRKNKSNNEKTTKKARHRKVLDSSKARRKSMASQDHSTVTRLDIGFELNETGDEIVVDSSHLKAN